MHTKKILFSAVIFGSLMMYACKKDDTGTNNSSDKCSSKKLALTADVTPNAPCSKLGKIVVHASGSKGWTYQLNSGASQSDSTFSGLATGTYSLTAKDAEGCTVSSTFNVTESTTKGPLFTDVTALVSLRCNGPCHNSGSGGAPVGIMSTDCKIIAIKSSMIQKAINENMGSLNSTEKAQLQNWVNAGGRYTD